MYQRTVRDKLIYLLLLVGLLICSGVGSVWADVVHLKNGGQLEGRVTQQGDRLKIEFRGGVIEVRGEDVERVEKKALAEDIFGGRLKNASGDAEACVELAQWARENNLEKEYILALRTALLIDHNHPKARRLLREYRLYRADLPDNKEASQKMLDDMGDGFGILRSRHYRICYNSVDVFAEISAERLEKLYDAFMVFFEDRNFEPAPLTDRLEVILFDSAQEYRRYAREVSPQMMHSAGFYSNVEQRSYFYDSISENNISYRDNKEKLQGQQQKIEEMRKEVIRNNDQSVQYVVTDSDGKEKKFNRDQMLGELKRQEDVLAGEFARLRDFYLNQNITVTIHEGTHQLAYTCGIHSRYYHNPKWLVEGLAIYFEAPDRSGWEQPGMLHRDRLKKFLAAGSSDRAITLEELITNDEMLEVSGPRAGDAYAATWALFYWLVNQQHEQLFDYIYDLSLRISQPDKPYAPQQRIEDFEKYFGEIGQLEQDWRDFMAETGRHI
jgi:hypothetical protein